jgi:hypothetical protein
MDVDHGRLDSGVYPATVREPARADHGRRHAAPAIVTLRHRPSPLTAAAGAGAVNSSAGTTARARRLQPMAFKRATGRTIFADTASVQQPPMQLGPLTATSGDQITGYHQHDQRRHPDAGRPSSSATLVEIPFEGRQTLPRLGRDNPWTASTGNQAGGGGDGSEFQFLHRDSRARRRQAVTLMALAAPLALLRRCRHR